MGRVWSLRSRWRNRAKGEKDFASTRGQRPKVRVFQTRHRGPQDQSEAFLWGWGWLPYPFIGRLCSMKLNDKKSVKYVNLINMMF